MTANPLEHISSSLSIVKNRVLALLEDIEKLRLLVEREKMECEGERERKVEVESRPGRPEVIELPPTVLPPPPRHRVRRTQSSLPLN
jgi:hypothetical protein